MTVVINGESSDIPDGLSVASMIEHLGMRLERVALERNRDILPRSQWRETPVQPNDNFEIVQLVGGG
jgi:thiamine biosynthesis protein ThiS